MMQINNINDWMLCLGAALSNGDELAIEELDGISRGWMQTDEERRAQQCLIEGAYDVIYAANGV